MTRFLLASLLFLTLSLAWAQAWSQPRIEVQSCSVFLNSPTRILADDGMMLGDARLSDFVFRTPASEAYLVREGAGSADYVGEDMSFRDYTVSGTAAVYFRHYNVNPEARLASVELDPPLTHEHLVLLVAPESHLQLVATDAQGEGVTTGRFVICGGVMNNYVLDATAFPGRDWSIVNVYSPVVWRLTYKDETAPECR